MVQLMRCTDTNCLKRENCQRYINPTAVHMFINSPREGADCGFLFSVDASFKNEMEKTYGKKLADIRADFDRENQKK